MQSRFISFVIENKKMSLSMKHNSSLSQIFALFISCLQKHICFFMKQRFKIGNNMMNRNAIATLCLFMILLFGCESQTQEFIKRQNEAINNVEKTLADTLYQTLIKTEKSDDTLAQNNALRKAIATAKEKGYPKLLFKCYNWFSIAYYKRGNYELSDTYIDSLAILADSTKIPELRPLKYIELAAKRNIKRTDSALHFYQLAIKDSTLLHKEALTLLLLNLGSAYREKGFYKEAIPYVSQSVEILETQGAKSDAEWTTLLNGKSSLFWINLNLKDTATAFSHLQSTFYIISRPGVTPKPEMYADLGSYYLFRSMPDSALYYFDILETQVHAVESKSTRVRPYLCKAKAYIQKQAFTTANDYLNRVDTLLQLQHPESNKNVRAYIKSEFYSLKYRVEKALGNTRQALNALELLKQLDDKKSEELQSFRISELEKTLTEARAEKTIAAKEQKINEQKRYNIYVTLSACILGLIGWLVIRDQRRKRSLEVQKSAQLQQQMVLEKAQARLQAEDEERKRIAQEIHDDISPTITTLSLAAHTISITEQKEVIAKTTQTIVRMTKQMSQQLNEIIWSLNSAADELSELNAFIRKFAEGFLKDVSMQLVLESNIANDTTKMEGYKRRAIFHSIKETINNAVKYSGGSELSISLLREGVQLKIVIKDSGTGIIEGGQIQGSGNGLKNIDRNIENVGGKVLRENMDGLMSTFIIPLESIS